MASYTVYLEPLGRREKVDSDQSLLEIARKLGINIISMCDGRGLCGGCKVQVVEGKTSPLTSKELDNLTQKEICQNYRLACQVRPLSNLKIRIPQESLSTPQRTQVEGLEIPVTPEPVVSSYELKLDPPSLSEPEGYAEVILKALKNCQRVGIEVSRQQLPRLKSLNWNIDAIVRNGELISINPPSTRKLGLAVDLGTTKIAGYIVDLEKGETLICKGMMNPQIPYGEDVITRISRAGENKKEAKKLQALVVKALNQLTKEMCAEIRANREQILDAVVVGNTAMHHLFLGLPVKQLGLSPYAPALESSIDVKAREVGLKIAPGAYVYFLPNIDGFVGSDHVAMLLTTDLAKFAGIALALDIGTNTEICLADHGKLTSVSCASGPAFEGGHIKCGMRACEGAIEKVRIFNGDVDYHTIGNGKPVGICGSGIVDAVAQLYLNGIIEGNGRERDHERVRETENGKEFVIAGEEAGCDQPVTITQRDVHEVQLAKGAISAGIQVLLEQNGLSVSDLEKIIIAGAFGSYMDVRSAIPIGMLPPLPLGHFEQIGNAAGMGAKLALISKTKRKEAEEVAKKTSYLELAAVPSFMRIFAHATCFTSEWKF